MPDTTSDRLSITLSPQEWNQILDVLGDGRFKIVQPLIQRIVEQAQRTQQPQQTQQPPRLTSVD